MYEDERLKIGDHLVADILRRWIMFFLLVHEKNDFAGVPQNLVDADLKIIWLDYQNNYEECSSIMKNVTKKMLIC